MKETRTFYTQFTRLSKMDITAAFMSLTDEECGFILKAHNGNLDGNRVTLNEVEQKKYYDIVYKIYEIIRMSKMPKSKKVKKSKTLVNRFPDYTLDELKDAVSRLNTDYQLILRKVYGNDLDGIYDKSKLNDIELSKINNIYTALKKKLQTPLKAQSVTVEKGRKDFYGHFDGYREFDIDCAFSELGAEQKKVIQKAYGISLNHSFCGDNLSKKEKRVLSSAFSIMHVKLQKYPKHVKKTPVNKTVTSLSTESVKIKKKARGPQPKTLTDLYKNYTFDQIREVIESLKPESQELIKRAYGESLSEPKDISDLSTSEKKKLDGLVYVLIKKHLKKTSLVSTSNMGEGDKKISKDSQVQPKKISRKKEARVSTNIANDFLDKISYKRLSLSEEIHLIKCSKLSFYDDATSEEREKYIKYFCEENPWFAEKLSLATTDEERQEVILEGIEKSFEIRDKFIENYILLAASYARKVNTTVIPTVDLIQEGIFGIIRALEKFDVDRNFKFSTYATHWIQVTMSRYVANNDRLIRVPVHQYDFVRKVLKKESDLTCQLGRKPEINEIADALDVSVKKVEQAKIDSYAITSLNQYVGEGEDELGDFIADANSEYEETVIDDICSEEFRNILLNSDLSEREIEILYMRYGFYDGKRYTLEQVGSVFGLTRERIRQIEAKALMKLRTNIDMITFSDFYLDKSGDKVYKKSVN